MVEDPLIELTSFASKLKIAPEVIGPAVAVARSFGADVIGAIVIRAAIKNAMPGVRPLCAKIGTPN